jgi:TP53 regulating kinase and related kinases
MKEQNKKIIAQGAEAIITLEKNRITKTRISKSYRFPELDKKIIKRRTKAETKIMIKASKIINVPILILEKKKISLPESKTSRVFNEIKMSFIKGEKLSEYLSSYKQEKQEKIMYQIGKSVAKLHLSGIIHGDLTTSNMILEKNKVFLIDFGLAFQNGKYEDKGVDLHLLKQALESKHFRNWQTLFKEFEIGYRNIKPKEAQKVFDRMKAIEKRGRYRH